MKRIAKLTVIMLLVLLMSPLAVFATPKGYKEVTLTKKNFKKYFEVVKMKKYDEFGDYKGYDFVLKSKLLKKGYYLYKIDDFAYKFSLKEKYKYKYKKKSYKKTYKTKGTRNSLNYLDGWTNYSGYKYDYKYGKVKSFKISKAKGKLIFATPDNVIGVDKRHDDYNNHWYLIKLKLPYDKRTDYVDHYDEENDKCIIDYYCTTPHTYNDGKNKYGIIIG